MPNKLAYVVPFWLLFHIPLISISDFASCKASLKFDLTAFKACSAPDISPFAAFQRAIKELANPSTTEIAPPKTLVIIMPTTRTHLPKMPNMFITDIVVPIIVVRTSINHSITSTKASTGPLVSVTTIAKFTRESIQLAM